MWNTSFYIPFVVWATVLLNLLTFGTATFAPGCTDNHAEQVQTVLNCYFHVYKEDIPLRNATAQLLHSVGQGDVANFCRNQLRFNYCLGGMFGDNSEFQRNLTCLAREHYLDIMTSGFQLYHLSIFLCGRGSYLYDYPHHANCFREFIGEAHEADCWQSAKKGQLTLNANSVGGAVGTNSSSEETGNNSTSMTDQLINIQLTVSESENLNDCEINTSAYYCSIERFAQKCGEGAKFYQKLWEEVTIPTFECDNLSRDVVNKVKLSGVEGSHV